MISLKDVQLVKNKKILLQIDNFTLMQGKTQAVIGSNGAGKSTFLKVLALLERPTAGTVFFGDQEVSEKNILSFRRRMAVVFQEPLLLNSTVYNNVAQGLKLRGVDSSETARRVNYWLERLGIITLRDRKPVFLSGGEAQRVSLARAFALEPEVIFLDEPFSALDFPTRINLLEELNQILSNTQATAVFVTHDFNEIPYLTKDIVFIDDGTVVYSGSLEDLMAGKVQIDAVQHLLQPLRKTNKLFQFNLN